MELFIAKPSGKVCKTQCTLSKRFNNI